MRRALDLTRCPVCVLQPSNMLMAKVADFGTSRIYSGEFLLGSDPPASGQAGPEKLGGTESILAFAGTPMYMSPETYAETMPAGLEPEKVHAYFR